MEERLYLTSIFLKVRGAQIEASVTGTLTSGMVGIPVTIEYDEAWEGLTKNLVCRCSGQDTGSTEQRAILNVGNSAVVAHEVMQAGKHLWLGVEGYNADGTLVIPTAWAMCGVIQKGANTGEDLSADPTLPVWNQLQAQIDRIECGGIPPEQLEEIRACAGAAAQAEENAAAASRLAADHADTARANGEAAQIYMENSRTSAASAANMANDAFRYQMAAEAAAERAEDAVGSFHGSGITSAQIHALDGMLRVCAFVRNNISPEYNAFRGAFGLDFSEDTGRTLTGISAVYSGGSVPVGTAVSALTGVVVTAHYSDGSTVVVTGYTLSGTIAEGSNTITVTYGGMTDTITVVGEKTGGTHVLETYAFSMDNPGTVAGDNGMLEVNGAYNSTGRVALDDGADTLTVYTDPVGQAGPYIAFYGADGAFLGRQIKKGALQAYDIPAGATEFILTVQATVVTTVIYKGTVTADQIGGAA